MFRRILVLLALGLLYVGCMRTWIGLVPSGRKLQEPQSVFATGTLRNLLEPTPNVFCGGEPQESDDFAALARLGVRTVVSVDGVRPNLELASRHGLDYVHIPIGYDGVDLHAQRSLMRLVQDHTEPIYIHCHHGRHRGPAAAAIFCRAMGDFDSDQAIRFLKRAGTDPLYTGLYRDVREFKIPAKDIPLPALVSAAEVESLAAEMGEIDRIFDRLSKEVRAEDTLLLLEAFREAARNLDQHSSAEDKLLASMESAVADCRELHEAQRHAAEQRITLERISLRCAECHKQFRDAN